tara:strand:+ start:303 stop:620 length:318 start_codon:yes stop_codon:yes gene_type:complete
MTSFSVKVLVSEYDHKDVCDNIGFVLKNKSELEKVYEYGIVEEINIPFKINPTYIDTSGYLKKEFYFSIKDYIKDINSVIVKYKGHKTCCGGGVRKSINFIKTIQ